MGKKLIINVLYNLVIFVAIITGYQYGIGQTPHNYSYLVGAVIIIAIFIVLKIRLLKQIKEAQKP